MKANQLYERNITDMPYRVLELLEHALANDTFKGMHFKNEILNVKILDLQSLFQKAINSSKQLTEIQIIPVEEQDNESLRSMFGYFCEAYEPIAAFITFDAEREFIRIIIIN